MPCRRSVWRARRDVADFGGGTSTTQFPYTTVKGVSNLPETSVGVPEDTASFEVVQAGPRRLCLRGELDMAGVPDVRARVGAMSGDVELDCSGVTFIDACGLGVLVAAHRWCEARDAKLTIVEPSRCVVRLLDVAGLDSVLGGKAGSSAP